MKLQERVARRRDQTIRKADVEAVFEDNDPEHSFIAYVKKTLEMNLDPLGRFLILLVAGEANDARRFTLGQLVDYARLARTPLPLEDIRSSLEQLKVTSVVRESQPEVYEFTVPEYPRILNRLGETRHLDELEHLIERGLERRDAGR